MSSFPQIIERQCIYIKFALIAALAVLGGCRADGSARTERKTGDELAGSWYYDSDSACYADGSVTYFSGKEMYVRSNGIEAALATDVKYESIGSKHRLSLRLLEESKGADVFTIIFQDDGYKIEPLKIIKGNLAQEMGARFRKVMTLRRCEYPTLFGSINLFFFKTPYTDSKHVRFDINKLRAAAARTK